MTNAPIDSSTAVETANLRTSRGGRCTPEGSVRDRFRRPSSSERLGVPAAGCTSAHLPPLTLPFPLPCELPWLVPCPLPFAWPLPFAAPWPCALPLPFPLPLPLSVPWPCALP